MSTSPFPKHWLPIYHRLLRRINMFSDFTQHLSLLIKTSYKKEPTECWKLCTLIWERLINFYMLLLPPRTFFLDDILLLIICLPKHAYAAGASTQATLQEVYREETNGQCFVPHREMYSSCINMRVPAGDLIDMQIHTVITSRWAKEMPTFVCSSFCLIKGFFCNPYHIVWKGWLTKHALLAEETDCWSS